MYASEFMMTLWLGQREYVIGQIGKLNAVYKKKMWKKEYGITNFITKQIMSLKSI